MKKGHWQQGHYWAYSSAASCWASSDYRLPNGFSTRRPCPAPRTESELVLNFVDQS
jgi:hypothetical protein